MQYFQNSIGQEWTPISYNGEDPTSSDNVSASKTTYKTSDGKFFIKSLVNSADLDEFMGDRATKYFEHLSAQPSSLIEKYCGMYRVGTWSLVIIYNPIPSNMAINETFEVTQLNSIKQVRRE